MADKPSKPSQPQEKPIQAVPPIIKPAQPSDQLKGEPPAPNVKGSGKSGRT